MPKTSSGDQDHPALAFPFFAPNLGFATVQPVMPNLGNVAEFNRRNLAHWAEQSREWTAFLSRRAQEDVALVHQLADCSGPQQVYEVYASFFQKAFADYQHESTEMMRLGQASLAEATDATRKTVETATRAAKRPSA